jgi:hypothetical protein
MAYYFIRHFMKRLGINIFIFFVLLSGSFISYGQTHQNKDYLVRIDDSIKDEYGYRNLNGDTVIPLGKYALCFTDTFKTFAFVIKPYVGMVAIDRQEKVLYQAFSYDNGPDLISDGLFRIIENSKIGFADALTGKVIIKPQFDCAWPFKNGVAKVSLECTKVPVGEYTTWVSDNWYYIDKSGKKVNKPR